MFSLDIGWRPALLDVTACWIGLRAFFFHANGR